MWVGCQLLSIGEFALRQSSYYHFAFMTAWSLAKTLVVDHPGIKEFRVQRLLVKDLTYTQVAAGHVHTVLLKSDGTVAAYGSNEDGQCNIPVLGQ